MSFFFDLSFLVHTKILQEVTNIQGEHFTFRWMVWMVLLAPYFTACQSSREPILWHHPTQFKDNVFNVEKPTWSPDQTFSLLIYPVFLSIIRADDCTTCGEHQAGQSPGEVCQCRRSGTACGCLPRNPLCQAPAGIPEVCTTRACRTMELREEHHLLSSQVSLTRGW